jgi:hypothetical protein
MLAIVVVWYAKRSADRLSFYATLLRLSISVAQKTYRADYLGSGKAQMPFDSASEWPGRQSMRSDQLCVLKTLSALIS